MRRLAQLVLYNWTKIKEVGQWFYTSTLLLILSGSTVVLSMGGLQVLAIIQWRSSARVLQGDKLANEPCKEDSTDCTPDSVNCLSM